MAKFVLTADSTQITAAVECKQKWLNAHYKHLEPLAFKTDESMNAGTYGHRLMDIFYRAKARGVDYNTTMELVYAYDPDKDMCECGCSQDLHKPVPALSIEECTRCKKCIHFRPKPFELNTKDRLKIQRRFNEYTCKYLKEDFIPLSEQHVEVGFSNTIYEDAENVFILEGRIDLIAKWQGLEQVFVDHKFQAKTYWLYPRIPQFKNYALATGITTGVINYVRLLDTKTLKKDKLDDVLARRIVNFNQVEIAAWQKRVVRVFFDMKKTIQASDSGKPELVDRNWGACSGFKLTYEEKFPNYCWYTELCESFDKTIAERKEKTLYKINPNPWRPW